MSAKKKVGVIIAIVTIIVFGYTQYILASQIGVTVTKNEFLETTDEGSRYNVQLEFSNPSLLVLTAGKTDFTITIDDVKTADGVLDPFVLPPLSTVSVQGIYLEDNKSETRDESSSKVMIHGITKYDVFFTSIEVPFIYFPSDEQARGFIHQK